MERCRTTVEPRFNEGYNNVSLYRGSFSYILLLLGKENRPLNGGLRYIEVRYIEAPLCNEVSLYRGSFPQFTISGIKKIVRYTEDSVIHRFVISRFHCNEVSLYRGSFSYILL